MTKEFWKRTQFNCYQSNIFAISLHHTKHMYVPYVLWNLTFVLYTFVTHKQINFTLFQAMPEYIWVFFFFSISFYTFLFRFDHLLLINIIKISQKFTTLSSLYGCFLVFVIVFVFVFTLRSVSQELVFVVIGERLLVECRC